MEPAHENRRTTRMENPRSNAEIRLRRSEYFWRNDVSSRSLNELISLPRTFGTYVASSNVNDS